MPKINKNSAYGTIYEYIFMKELNNLIIARKKIEDETDYGFFVFTMEEWNSTCPYFEHAADSFEEAIEFAENYIDDPYEAWCEALVGGE